MNAKEKAKPVHQAGKLYTLGMAVEKHRDNLRRLVEKGTPYDSPKTKTALENFQKIDSEWKRLEQEHLDYKRQLGIDP